MRKITSNLAVVTFGLIVSAIAHAGLLFKYNELATRDLDQMSKIVHDKVKEAKKSGGDRVIPLKEALQAVYSRPNEDGMIEKVVSPIKNALDEDEAWEKVIKKLTQEAIGALKNPKAFKPAVQVTYLVFLENLISESKPNSTKTFEQGILSTIRDAKIEVTKEAQHERLLKMMKEARSPSVVADEVLKLPPPTPTPEEKAEPVGETVELKKKDKVEKEKPKDSQP